MKYKVCVLTGTRAEYGVLREILYRLKNNDMILLDLLVTGTHLVEAFGNTQEEIQKDGFAQYSAVPIPMDDDTKYGMAKATGIAVTRFTDYLNIGKPVLVIVLGDRFEALAMAVAAHVCGIPIAHISGGDITEGAVDDAIRHSITKMSQLHFAGCEQSARRIVQMGEQPYTVFNVGEPGVENCLKIKHMKRAELAENLNFAGVLDCYAIVTYHPVTMENNTGVKQVRELIRAMDAVEEMSYIITMANADAGGREINELWIKEQKKRDNWYVISSLGNLRYLSAMKYAKIVIGNSSSGIIEAPAMGIPTVNIGERQKGRKLSESVVCCQAVYEEILRAIQYALSEEFQEKAKSVVSLFGNGTTSMQIEEQIMKYLLRNDFTTQKHFYDIKL